MSLLRNVTDRFMHRMHQQTHYRSIWDFIHIDFSLLMGLIMLILFGFIVLYSAGGANLRIVEQQAAHMCVAGFVMIIFAQFSPNTYQRWAPTLYTIGLVLLAGVLVIGHINKGAQRWLDLGIIHFQPSELMKLAIPMTISMILSKKALPPSPKLTLLCFALIGVPFLLTAKQPDLGTAILLLLSGLSVLFLAGLSWRWIASGATLLIICAPFMWYFMHDYQRERVLIFLNPERDPLGAGYHIIQSKIAIGSGGLLGKGWLNGTQSHLHFLPEHSTDFIFAVCGEEFGLIGAFILLILYSFIIIRGFGIALESRDTFSRLLAGSISLTFFVSLFINLGMVSGLLPVVGVPLPLVSYGGTSMVTMMASFGILMSIQTHKKLIG